MGELCGICRGAIENKAADVFCIYCETHYHRKHLQGWVDEETSCPSCRRDFPDEFLEAINMDNPYKIIQDQREKVLMDLLQGEDPRERRQQQAMKRTHDTRRYAEYPQQQDGPNLVVIFFLILVIVVIMTGSVLF